MPKIRGVKPELWTDENFVELSPFARLLWIGLWNHACDNGHVQDKSKQIKMRVLPTDDVNCAELLREIEGQKLIERSDGWITIPNLSHHQKPHRRWWSTCDKPGCDLPEGASHTPSNRGTTVAPPKANRGTTADSDCEVDCEVDCESDGDGDKSVRPTDVDRPTQPDRFQEFWDVFGNKVKRKDAERRWRIALKKPGVTADLLILAAGEYVAWERANNDGGRYIAHPSTWLNGERWTDERSARAQPQTRVQEHLALVRQLAEAEGNPTQPQIGQRR